MQGTGLKSMCMNCYDELTKMDQMSTQDSIDALKATTQEIREDAGFVDTAVSLLVAFRSWQGVEDPARRGLQLADATADRRMGGASWKGMATRFGLAPCGGSVGCGSPSGRS
jgi:hypothetical protein